MQQCRRQRNTQNSSDEKKLSKLASCRSTSKSPSQPAGMSIKKGEPLIGRETRLSVIWRDVNLCNPGKTKRPDGVIIDRVTSRPTLYPFTPGIVSALSYTGFNQANSPNNSRAHSLYRRAAAAGSMKPAFRRFVPFLSIQASQLEACLSQ